MSSEAVVAPPSHGRKGWVWALVLVGVLLMGGLAVLVALEAKGGGSEVSAVTLKKHGGGTLKLGDLKGQVVMVDFWATWCPPCKAEMPALVRLAKEFEAQGLAFVAVSQDDSDAAEYLVQQFMDRHQPDLAPYVVYGTHEVAQLFKVEALPTLYFLDREGRIMSVHRGMLDEQEMRRNIEASLRH
jgi:thiol-disulfide isomerase/thioredoxin